MIVIFAIFLTTVFAQQNNYIDLLPENGKQELLDNVARRIMESVVSNGTKEVSIELADAQLNERNSFIQSVMEQETAAFEARRNKREDRSSENSNKSKDNDDLEVKPFQFRDDDVDKLDTTEAVSKEGLEVKPYRFGDTDVDKLDTSADKIGLTVTGLNHPGYDKVPQDNLQTDTLLLQTRSVTSDVNNEKSTEASTIQNSNEEKVESTFDSETQLKDSKPVDLTTETQKLKFEYTNVFENNAQYQNTIETKVPQSFTATLQKSANAPTEAATGTKKKILENVSAIKFDDFEPSLNAESYAQNSSDGTLAIFLTNVSATNSVIDTTTNKTSNLLTTLNNQIFTTTTQNKAELHSAITENYSVVTEDRSTNEHLQTITETTTFTPILTTSNIEEKQSTKKPKKIKFSKTIKPPENYTLVSYVASKALKSIKHELELKKQGKFIDNEIKTKNKENTHLNYYRVYKIPLPIKRDNQPFLRSQEPIKDQPYFVPVYKYSPNFAYYNPKNRLGPNEVEEISIELDSYLREENNKIHHKVEPREFILQLNNELRKFGIFKRKKTTTTESPFPTEGTVLQEEPEKEPKATEEEWTAEEEKAAEKVKAAHEDKTKEETTTLQDFNKSDEEIFHSTLAPTTNVFGFTGFDCESTDNESQNSNCKTSTETVTKERSDNKKRGPTIAEILNATDTLDLLITLEKLQALDIPLMRSKPESKVHIYMNVLKDLILEDSKSLKQYDWLTTTVQIQLALSKILKLIKRMKQSMQLYPAELQVLRYMVFLHNFSFKIKKDNEQGNKLKKRPKHLPRHKKKWKTKLSKDKGFISKVGLYLRMPLPDLVEDDGLSNLYKFLIDVQDVLFDLHEAIRHIADVTKFDRQNWYGNLKQLYLSADEKHLRELLLHISMSRLVDLVDHSCKHSLDHDFIQFVKSNKKDAKRIVEEMIFIIDIVHEITINKE